MNCQIFETIINDLERGGVMDAQMRDGALTHSEVCERCAARLQDERMLTAGLRKVAAIAEAKEAPARIESALLAAFRQQHSHKLAPVINQSHRRRWAAWALATAATILILLTLAAIRVGRSPHGPVESAKDVKQEQTVPGQTLAGQALPGQASPVQTPHKSTPPNNVAPNIRERQAVALYKPRAPRPAPSRNVDRGESKPETGGADATEIATEFMPLVHGDNLNSMESGQIVRVELPRSALISFGLPMNMERADERIKADVVLGNDGLARAIRFVK